LLAAANAPGILDRVEDGEILLVVGDQATVARDPAEVSA